MDRKEYLCLMGSRLEENAAGDVFKWVGKAIGKEKKAAKAVAKLESPGKANKEIHHRPVAPAAPVQAFAANASREGRVHKKNSGHFLGTGRKVEKKKALHAVGKRLKVRTRKGVERAKKEIPELPRKAATAAGKVGAAAGNAAAKHVLGDNWKRKVGAAAGTVGIGGALYKGRHHIAGLFRRTPSTKVINSLKAHKSLWNHLKNHKRKIAAGTAAAGVGLHIYRKHKNRNK